eukprot:274163-Chlamydomonas_euryale.AAC.1
MGGARVCVCVCPRGYTCGGVLPCLSVHRGAVHCTNCVVWCCDAVQSATLHYVALRRSTSHDPAQLSGCNALHLRDRKVTTSVTLQSHALLVTNVDVEDLRETPTHTG